MALKNNWIDKIDNVDDILAEHINSIAHAVIENEENKADKNLSNIDNATFKQKAEQAGIGGGGNIIVDQTYNPTSENAQSGKAVAEALINYPKKDEVIPTPTTANIGQTIMVKEVDESGKPTKWEATDIGGGTSTSKEWELAASYVHEGNRVIQPTALDKTTGYFTCEGHGLTEGQTVMVLSNPEYFTTQLSYIPYELYQKCNFDIARLYVRLKTVTIINENTFALVKSDNSIYTYTAPQSINADATKFYFETVDGGIFTGFNNLNIDMRDYDIKIVAKNPHIRVSLAINNYSNGYQYLTPYGGEGGIAFGVHVTPACDVYSIGEAIWKFDGKVLTNDSRSTTRWGRTLTPLENIVITEGYINNIFIDSTNKSFCENPIINKLNINFYLADKYMRNGGFIEIWKKKK